MCHQGTFDNCKTRRAIKRSHWLCVRRSQGFDQTSKTSRVGRQPNMPWQLNGARSAANIQTAGVTRAGLRGHCTAARTCMLILTCLAHRHLCDFAKLTTGWLRVPMQLAHATTCR